MKKVLFLIAQNNYQPLEYAVPKDILESAGIKVVTVSNQVGIATSTGNYSSTKVDLSLENIKMDDFEGLFIIGGVGAVEYLDNEIVYNLLKVWQKTGKAYGAICISPRILAKAGVLKNKKATGWNDDGKLEDLLLENGAIYNNNSVVVDGNVITAAGPASAEEFGKEIVKVLQ
ncbi:MAG: DJ-1/PfpI family protein [Patescibacteria group bacterium]|jgi:protease I|nr:DJ-1/PfpI family protein [Candidatus Magasanikbacteria bacterium]